MDNIPRAHRRDLIQFALSLLFEDLPRVYQETIPELFLIIRHLFISIIWTIKISFKVLILAIKTFLLLIRWLPYLLVRSPIIFLVIKISTWILANSPHPWNQYPTVILQPILSYLLTVEFLIFVVYYCFGFLLLYGLHLLVFHSKVITRVLFRLVVLYIVLLPLLIAILLLFHVVGR